jgi:hypothetical protein
MKYYFRIIPALALSLSGSVFAPIVKADDWNKKTDITINQPIEVQNRILPAGSYVIKLLNSSADRYTVQIFNAAENRIFATIFAIPVYRERATDKSEFSFYKFENGSPAALHTWFHPGDIIGYEFTSSREETLLQAQRRHANPTVVNAGSDD